MRNHNSDSFHRQKVVSPGKQFPKPIRNIKTRYNGISFKGLNEAKIFALLQECLKANHCEDIKLVYEPQSFELKSLRTAYVPDFGLILPDGHVIYIESKCFDVPLEDAQLRCSALSLTGRPCLLLVGYPAYLKAQLWLNGFGGKFVELPFPEHAVQVASSFSPWTSQGPATKNRFGSQRIANNREDL
jgi:hypothetical protein